MIKTKHLTLAIITILAIAGLVWVSLPKATIQASSDVVAISIDSQSKDIGFQLDSELAPDTTVKFEPSGTHIKNGKLKIRLDVYLGESYESYKDYYLSVVDKSSREFIDGYKGKLDKDGNPIDEIDYHHWLDSLPHKMQLTPVLCVFVGIDEITTISEIQEYIKWMMDSSTAAILDRIIKMADSSHYVSPLMKNRTTFSTALTARSDTQKLIDETNTKFAALSLSSSTGEISKPSLIEPKSIDVGPGATNRTSYYNSSTSTVIEMNNPANATGTLDTFEVWLYADDATGYKIGTFSGSGTTYTSRDYETLGAITAGAKRTFTTLDCDVTTGDYLGCRRLGSSLIEEGNSATGYRNKAGDQFGTGEQTGYSAVVENVHSIYATGTEPSYDITNDPSSKAFGVVAASSTYYADGGAPNNPVQDGDCNFTITNNGSVCDIDIHGHSFTGGVGWTLTSNAPGSNEIRITTYYSGQNPASGIVITTSDQEFYDNLAASGTIKWDLKLETGTFTDGTAKTGVITLTAVAPD